MSEECVISTRKRTASLSSSSSEVEKSDSTSNVISKSNSETSPVRGRDIPPITSQWTENHLSSLGVEVVFSSISSPVNIIESVFESALYIVKYEEIEAKDLKLEILTKPPNGWENFKKYRSISDILKTDLKKLESALTSLNNVKHNTIEGSTWLPQVPGVHQLTVPPEKLFARYRFYIMGEQFSRYLLYMAEIEQRGEIITEKMYQILFNLFLGMFGLFGNQAPPTGNMDINSKNIESVPDMMVSQNGKIIAIIEVKKNLKKEGVEEKGPPLKTRKMSGQKDQTQKINHLDEHIVGKTGGDMLAHLEATASNKNKILGIMVQETHVTFTYLEKKTGNEKEGNDTGNTSSKGNYSMKFSKPYNYLDPEEREDLLEPLILLSLLQNNPKFLLTSK